MFIVEDSTVLMNLTVVSQGCLQNLTRDTQQVVGRTGGL